MSGDRHGVAPATNVELGLKKTPSGVDDQLPKEHHRITMATERRKASGNDEQIQYSY